MGIFGKISITILEKIFNFDFNRAADFEKDWWIFLIVLIFAIGGLVIGIIFLKYLFLYLKLMNKHEAEDFLPTRTFPDSWLESKQGTQIKERFRA